jgi:hypothetical protein
MMWGKLLGATSANWFGGLLCLPVILWAAWRDAGPVPALSFGIILLALGLFAQAASLLSSLVLIRRNSGNWRLDTFLCQVAGIGAGFFYYSFWSSIDTFEATGLRTLVWWGQEFNLSAFLFVSLMIFVTWALVGAWRAMRAELRFANGPFLWLAYLAYLAFHSAGFHSGVASARGSRRCCAIAVRARRTGLCRVAVFGLFHGLSGAQGSGASALAGRAGARRALL